MKVGRFFSMTGSKLTKTQGPFESFANVPAPSLPPFCQTFPLPSSLL